MIERDDPKDEVGSFAPPTADRKRLTFAIPPSTPARKCRSCGATVYWIRTEAGRNMPCDPDGTSHFATCPHDYMWRVRR